MTVGDLELSSVDVWAVRYRRNGVTPTPESRSLSKIHATEDMPPAARGPRFTNQGAVSERGLVGAADMIKDFVDDFDGEGDGNRVSAILQREGDMRAYGKCQSGRNLTTGTPSVSIRVGDGERAN